MDRLNASEHVEVGKGNKKKSKGRVMCAFLKSTSFHFFLKNQRFGFAISVCDLD